MAADRRDSTLDLRIENSLKAKMRPYLETRQATQLVTTLLKAFFKDEAGADQLRLRNAILRAKVTEMEAEFAANEQRIAAIERSAQQTQVQYAAEARFREEVRRRKAATVQTVRGIVPMMDVARWRSVAESWSDALVKPALRKQIIKEEAGVDLF